VCLIHSIKIIGVIKLFEISSQMSDKIDKLYLDKKNFLRGKTPEDIEKKCLDLCKNYLGGIWLKTNLDQVQVERLCGGLTNQLYYCAISKPLKPVCNEPQEVAIRLYGEKHYNNLDCGQNERLTDVVIALLVSEYKLGPKIYGLFENGQIQQYYKVRVFSINKNINKLIYYLV